MKIGLGWSHVFRAWWELSSRVTGEAPSPSLILESVSRRTVCDIIH